MRVFVAGASGAIGEPLIAELLKQGHSVTGMTTHEARGKKLESQGAEAVIADALDFAAVLSAVRQSKPDAVIDQLTSLPKDLGDMPAYAARDRKLRLEGGGNLLSAAIECGVRRYLQQSSGFFLEAAEGGLADESSSLDVNASPGVAASAQTYAKLERRLFSAGKLKVWHYGTASFMGRTRGITLEAPPQSW